VSEKIWPVVLLIKFLTEFDDLENDISIQKRTPLLMGGDLSAKLL